MDSIGEKEISKINIEKVNNKAEEDAKNSRNDTSSGHMETHD